MPRFSIIVPVYNTSSYLDQCMDSFVNQTFSDLEILLVDDGSTDNSGALCDSWAARDSRVRVIHKRNEGVSTARNIGIENAKGMYIWFVDSDDYIEKNSLELINSHLIDDEDHLLVLGYSIDYPDYTNTINYEQTKLYVGKSEMAEAIYQMDSKHFALAISCNKIFRNDFIRKHNLSFDLIKQNGEDLIFVADALHHLQSVTLLAEPLYHYMQREADSLSRKYRSNLYKLTLNLNKIHSDLYNYFDMTSEKYDLCLSRICFDQLFAFVVNMYRKNSPMDRNARRKKFEDIFKDEDNRHYIINGGPSIFAKLMRMVLRLNSPLYADVLFYSLMKARYILKGIYPYIRLHVLHRSELKSRMEKE